MEDIKVFELFRTDLRGATVIDGFPSVGLVSTICANYLISSLDLRQIGIMDSIYFPTVSVVRDSEPLNPVRIYSGDIVNKDGDKKSIVVFISEFQPPPKLIKLIAGTILDWIVEQNCGILVSPEGLVIERANDPPISGEAGLENEDMLREVLAKAQGESKDGAAPENAGLDMKMALEMLRGSLGEKEKENTNAEDVELADGEENKADNRETSGDADNEVPGQKPHVDVYGIASTKEARELINDTWIKSFSEGVISGVAGVLLNEGKRRGFSVISLLAETRTEFPDARAAAKVIEAMDDAILHIGIDVEPLYKEAEDIEMKIKMMRAQVETPKRARHASPSMYG